MKNFNSLLNVILALLVVGYIGYYFYKLPKFDSGEYAKDFEGILITGEKFTLSDLKGKYVLLDFWGSWCGPCRMENPEIVSLYREFNTKNFNAGNGFEVVNIGMETNQDRWKKAIEHDGLIWKYHIGEFDKFSGPIAKLYGIKEIPTKYFINPEGMIIKVNPTISELRTYLSDIEEK